MDGRKKGGRKPGWSTDAQQIVDRVFVYGTLRSGQPPRSMIAEHVVDSTPATVRGRIYAFPEGYPGYMPEGDGTVVGEVIYLDGLAAAFALLDAYEGSDYRRVLERVRLADGTETWAWIYVLADPAIAAAGERIASGDWLEYLTART